jgi:two-component system, OmpR family, response regulator RegX3
VRIAVLEDDPSQLELLGHWLKLAGHRLCAFESGQDLLRALPHETFDALVLDWNVPDMTGLEVLVRLRRSSSVPVLFTTGRAAEQDVVQALRTGADDYLIKPIRRLELLARLESLTRRSGHQPAQVDIVEVDVFRIDCSSRLLLRKNKPLKLSAKDFDLAVLLLLNVGRLMPRDELQKAIWSSSGERRSRSLDMHVSRVRSALSLRPEHGWRLTAVYGHGYRLERVHRPGKGDEESG